MSKIGIGADQQNSQSQPSSGWQLGYAWATTYAPAVSTTQRQDKSISSVVANAQSSGVAPSISTSSSLNQNIQPSVSGVQASILAPSVQTSGAVNMTPPVGQVSATTGNHIVSVGSVVNASISSVTAGATASSGIPTVSAGSGSTSYYLQMDGVDDYIKLPSMTLTRIVMDLRVRHDPTVVRIYWDFRSGIGFSHLTHNTNGTDTWQTGTVKVNGTTVSTNNTSFVPDNTRITLEQIYGSAGTDDGNIFSASTGTANFTAGDIYSIQIYNGATLQASYDMSTGNVQDQSGNGRHATLNGGTWVVA